MGGLNAAASESAARDACDEAESAAAAAVSSGQEEAKGFAAELEQLTAMAGQARNLSDIERARKARDRVLQGLDKADIARRRLVHGACLHVASSASSDVREQMARKIYLEMVDDIQEANLDMKDTFLKLLRACAYAERPAPTTAVDWAEKAQRMGLEFDAELFGALAWCHAAAADSDKAEEVYNTAREAGVRPGEGLFSALIHAAALRGDVDHAERWFREMGSAQVPAGTAAYNALICAHSVTARRSRDEPAARAAERVLGEMRAAGVRPDEASFHSLVEAWDRLDDADRAGYWFGEMKRAGVEPKERTYKAIIAVHTRKCKLDDSAEGAEDAEDAEAAAAAAEAAAQALEEMAAKGHEVDAVALNAVIDSFAQRGDLERAGRYFERVRRAGWPSNPATYSIMIHAHAERSKATHDPGHAREAERLLREMRGRHAADGIAFTAAIDACANAGDTGRAGRLFREMKEAGVEPNVQTYNALINAHAKRAKMRRDPKQIDAAERILQAMLNDGAVEPSKNTIDTVMHACAQIGDVDRARRWFDEMKDADMQPSAHTYAVLIDAHAKRGKETRDEAQVKMAEQMFQLMNEENIQPDRVCYTALIDACAQLGNVERAKFWLHKMVNAGVQPNDHTYNALINAYAQHGRKTRNRKYVKEAEQFLEEMQEKGIVPDALSFKMLINTSAQVGDVDRAEKWFNRMKGSNIEPDIHAYGHLINAFAKNAVQSRSELPIKKAGMIILEMRDNGMKPNIVMFNTIVDAVAKIGNITLAARWVKAMESVGVEPDERTFNSLFIASAKSQSLKFAISAFEKMKKSIGLKPNQYLFATIMNACADGVDESGSVDYLDFAEEIVNEMVQRSIKPNAFHLSMFLKLYRRNPKDIRPKMWVQWILKRGVKNIEFQGQDQDKNRKALDEILASMSNRDKLIEHSG